MRWIQFERWLAQWFEDRGYRISMTPETNDRGIDIVGKRGGETTAIQAKAYGPNNPVNSPEVQQVAGLHARSDIDNVILGTTGSLTEEARKVAQNRDVHILTFEFSLTLEEANHVGPAGDRPANKSPLFRKTFECPECGDPLNTSGWFTLYKHFRDCSLPSNRPSHLSKKEWRMIRGKLIDDERSPAVEYTCPECGYEFERDEGMNKNWFRYANHFKQCELPDCRPDSLSESEWKKVQADI